MNRAPDTLVRPHEWKNRGACRLEDPDLFFPTSDAGQTSADCLENARAVCRACPVLELCARWALDTGEDHGVWGGLSERERRTIRRHNTGQTVPYLPEPRSLAKVLEERTVDLGDGHRGWVGTMPVAVDGRSYTPMRLAWQVEHGALPEGQLQSTCGRKGCVAGQHLRDRGAQPTP